MNRYIKTPFKFVISQINGNFVFLYTKTKTFVGTDLFAVFRFGRVWFTKPVA